MPDFKTERLKWRLPRETDVDGYMAFVSNYEVVKWTATWPHPAEREFVAARCVPVKPERGKAGPIIRNGEIIGGMGILDGELGYFIAQPHWSNGYATEVGHVAVSNAFHTQDWPEIGACVFQENAKSARVLEKLGFKYSNDCVSDCVSQGREMATYEYKLTRADWLATNPLHIETNRLEIRAFASGDTDAFHAVASRKEVAHMMQSIPHPLSMEQAQEWIDERIYNGRPGFFAGVYLKDGTLIGAVGIGGDPISTAYFFDPAYWGQGYASEAMKAFANWAFTQFHLDDLIAGAIVDNIASHRVLEKLGFSEISRKLHQPSLRVEPEPLIMYRLTRNRLKASA